MREITVCCCTTTTITFVSCFPVRFRFRFRSFCLKENSLVLFYHPPINVVFIQILISTTYCLYVCYVYVCYAYPSSCPFWSSCPFCAFCASFLHYVIITTTIIIVITSNQLNPITTIISLFYVYVNAYFSYAFTSCVIFYPFFSFIKNAFVIVDWLFCRYRNFGIMTIRYR